jgi:allantoate deiminase
MDARRSLEVVARCEEEGSRFEAHYWGKRAMLGLVEAIVGMHHRQITIRGRADHAGTTPMDMRRDALQGAAQMAIEITRLVEQEGRPAVVTLGTWSVKLGAVNIVPEEVSFSIDVRHPDEDTKQRLVAALLARCETIARQRGLTISSEITHESRPSKMDAALQSVVVQAAETCGASWKAMPSGAGHDSKEMVRHLPTAMVFVPSLEWRSRSAAEYTSPEDAAPASFQKPSAREPWGVVTDQSVHPD